jgi:Helix-hairpin-helix domain
MQEAASRTPAWVVVLVGGLAAASVLDVLSGRARRGAVPRPPACAAFGGPPARTLPPRSLAGMSPRELRALPGIGQVRAVDYARARWGHDPALGELALEDVPGIGPQTARRVAEALAGRAPAGEAGDEEDAAQDEPP